VTQSRPLDEGVSRTLRAIAFAMCNAVAVMAAIGCLFYWRSESVLPSPRSLRISNGMTIVTMAFACVGTLLSEMLWKRMRAGDVRLAYVVRLSLREGPAVLGCAALLFAARSGVLRAYPAYWADLVPAALFLSFVCVHWPSVDNLKAELGG
jgi:hypothetical protein